MLTLGQKPTCKEQLQSTQQKHRTKIWNQKQIHCAANMPVPLIIIWPACNAPRGESSCLHIFGEIHLDSFHQNDSMFVIMVILWINVEIFQIATTQTAFPFPHIKNVQLKLSLESSVRWTFWIGQRLHSSVALPSHKNGGSRPPLGMCEVRNLCGNAIWRGLIDMIMAPNGLTVLIVTCNKIQSLLRFRLRICPKIRLEFAFLQSGTNRVSSRRGKTFRSWHLKQDGGSTVCLIVTCFWCSWISSIKIVCTRTLWGDVALLVEMLFCRKPLRREQVPVRVFAKKWQYCWDRFDHIHFFRSEKQKPKYTVKTTWEVFHTFTSCACFLTPFRGRNLNFPHEKSGNKV